MFKCTGDCKNCGRCNNASILTDGGKSKEKFTLPSKLVFREGREGYGLAVDLGTTTVVAILVNLKNGQIMKTKATTNSQSQYGADVISRISFAGKKTENLKIIREEIIKTLNYLINGICQEEKLKREDIIEISICGNTTMAHILGGFNPQGLAFAPFKPEYTGELNFLGKDLGLEVSDRGQVWIFPAIAGHVGGDITAGLLSREVLETDGLSLFIDIGTNGEMVVFDGDKAFTCSTAAGPAFEGAAIYQGMRASTGAIEGVKITGENVAFKTIDKGEPVGICGSGIIDIVAQLLEAGVLDETGRLLHMDDIRATTGKDNNDNPMPATINRVRERNGIREFVIVYKENGDDIVITQKDIRELQMAKAAIYAGILVLLDKVNRQVDEIDKIILAGAFGNFIDKDSSIAIGLLPIVARDKIISAGNTAGVGAIMTLINPKTKEIACHIPRVVEHIELADSKNFQEYYIKAMSFYI